MYITLRRSFPLFVALALAASAFASTDKGCSMATLQGSFGFVLSGKNVALNGDYVLVGRFDADGNGAYNGSGSQSANGRIAHGAFSGTYKVNADCTGTADVTFANTGVKAQLDFVLVADGNELYMMDSGGKTVEFGEAKRLSFTGKSRKRKT